MRTANPVLNDRTFDPSNFSLDAARSEQMTLQGTSLKALFMLCFMVVTAGFTWSKTTSATDFGQVMPWVWGGALGGLVVGLIIRFKPTLAMYLAMPYAGLQGLFLGAISAIFEMRYPGIVMTAVTMTLGVAGALLFAYVTGVIKASENFKLGVTAATGGIFLVYMATWILGLFGIPMPYLHESGLIGIGFSLFVVTIAALNLVLDFDFIENGVERGAPKYMEWVGAFGLMVTLVWLYIEMLRLLSKLRER